MTGIFKALCGLLFALTCSFSFSQTISLTFDDGLDPDRQRDAAAWNREILAGLKEADVKAMVFPALVRIGGEAGLDLIREWAAQGHAVGNHTAGHRSLASPQVSLEDFISDIGKADAVLSRLPRWKPMLRFPYLKEGDTAAKRDGMRAWMQAHGYRTAAVSIDASDWYYNQVFSALAERGATQKARQVEDAYIDHLLDRAAYYDRLARQVLGYSPPHVMLLHTSRINAAAVPRIIRAFRARGWSFVSPLEAFEDPVYSTQPDTLPAGESIIWASAKARGVQGLRYPAEDSVYEEPGLKARGLLPQGMEK